MAPVQHFQCQSQGAPRREATIETKFDKKTKKNVIRWESITRAFPGAAYVFKDDMMVDFECDSDMEELVPRRIAAYPNEVLEVALVGQEVKDNSQIQSNINDTVTEHQDSAQGLIKTLSTCDLTHQVNHLTIIESGQQYPELGAMEATTGTSIYPINVPHMNDAFQHTANTCLQVIVDGQRHQANRIIDIVADHHADLSAAIARGNALQDELNTKQETIISKQDQMTFMQKELNEKQGCIIKLQEEMKDMQQQALDRLAIIQGRIQTVLTQNYELLEYPIPRLFIILPRETRFRDQFNPFTVPFRLYFLCECGTHTMGESNTTPHKIHIAKHEGYDIDQPTEFLEKYGPYILAVLQMIKYSTAMATVVVPGLVIADVSEQVKLASESIKHFKENFKDLIDEAISILQSKTESTDPTNGGEDQSEFNSIEALEGADLRQLESYLKHKDTSRTLGNLYRIVTNEGHVKWVCLDHYRENYKEVTRKQLQEIVESNRGELDENEGKISIGLGSRILARQFYDALQRTRGIYDLDIGLLWDATLDDLRQLETTVRVCNISILKLRAQHFSGPASDVFNRGRRFDPLLDIMTNGRIRSFELEGCQDFFKRISRFPQAGNTSILQNLILLNCDIRSPKDVRDLLDGLPRVKHIRVKENDVDIIFSRTDDPPKSTESRILGRFKIGLTPKSNNWMLTFKLSKMNIIHFEVDSVAISNSMLQHILISNQQMETLTFITSMAYIDVALMIETSQILQRRHHPLRRLTLENRYRSLEYKATLDFDHGHIISGTMQDSLCKTVGFNSKSASVTSASIEKEKLGKESNIAWDTLYDGSPALREFADAFPELQAQELLNHNL